MNVEEIVGRLLDCLDSAAIPYVLVGSFASNVYGIARSTQDADLVVQAEPGKLAELVGALGPEFERDQQSRFEAIAGTQLTLIRHRGSGFAIELFQLSSDPFDQERFARRRKLSFLGRDTWVLTPEDVLVTKLNWLHLANRAKDRVDVRGVLAVQGDAIDWSYVEAWTDKHGSRHLLESIRKELRQR